MERLQELITQLKEQFDRQAAPSQMLLTAQLLETELIRLSSQAAVSRGSAKVAVMMPSSMKIVSGLSAIQELKTTQELKYGSPELKNAAPEFKNGTAEGRNGSEAKGRNEVEIGRLNISEIKIERLTPAQQPSRELNDTIGNNIGFSLNDKLKAEVIELAAALNDTPVRDLKKAIGVNDRYVFINQLFRGDEVMYERSIKTINGFRILPEAEYWMERELKVKLGWDENREATRHFYQLVKRRFS
jgi:hypothetical protein